MANTITGTVESASPLLQIPTQNGKTFEKRELVLNCTTYNSQTGEPMENFVKIEFTGNNISLLDKVQPGQRIVVSFMLQGRKYQKRDGTMDCFTTIRGYRIEEPQTRVSTQPGEYRPQQAPPKPVYPQATQNHAQQPYQQPYGTYYPNQEPPVFPPQPELPF